MESQKTETITFGNGRTVTFDILEENELGRGSFGVNYVGVEEGTAKYAIKKICLGNQTKKQKARTFKEVEIMKKMHHPNLIRYFDSIVKGDYLYILMELAQESLGETMKKFQNIENLSMKDMLEIINLFFQICLGVFNLHLQQNIAHRDLKLENILCIYILEKQKDGKFLERKIMKIADFGLSREQTEEYLSTYLAGTKQYLSPEILNPLFGKESDSETSKSDESEPHDGVKTFFKQDSWALAVLLHYMFYFKFPFRTKRGQFKQSRAVRAKYKEETEQSPLISALIKSIFVVDPNERMGIRSITNLVKIIKNEYQKKVNDGEYQIMQIKTFKEHIQKEKEFELKENENKQVNEDNEIIQEVLQTLYRNQILNQVQQNQEEEEEKIIDQKDQKKYIIIGGNFDEQNEEIKIDEPDIRQDRKILTSEEIKERAGKILFEKAKKGEIGFAEFNEELEKMIKNPEFIQEENEKFNQQIQSNQKEGNSFQQSKVQKNYQQYEEKKMDQSDQDTIQNQDARQRNVIQYKEEGGKVDESEYQMVDLSQQVEMMQHSKKKIPEKDMISLENAMKIQQQAKWLGTLKDVRTWLDANKKSKYFAMKLDGFNNFQKKDQTQILKQLSNFNNLCGIYISFYEMNDLDRNMLLEVQNVLKGQLCLRYLKMYFYENYSKELNDLTNSIFKTVPNEIQGLGLSFGNSGLTDSGCEKIFNVIGQLAQLKELFLWTQRSECTKSHIEMFMKIAPNLKDIREIEFFHNAFGNDEKLGNLLESQLKMKAESDNGKDDYGYWMTHYKK